MQQDVQEEGLDAQLEAIARDASLRGEIYGKIGEYCHQCRNRLNSLKLGLYLVKQLAASENIGCWSEVDHHYSELESRLEHLQRLCRPLALSRIRIDLDLLIADRRKSWTQLWVAADRRLRFEIPIRPVVASLDVDRMGQALDGIIAWRARAAAGGVDTEVRWWIESGDVHLSWAEQHSDHSRESSGEDRWPLAWLIRVVAEHEGQTTVREEDGWTIEICWPSATAPCPETSALVGTSP